jgi:hypothetical protein
MLNSDTYTGEHKVWNKIHVMFLRKSLGHVNFILKNAIL